MSEKKISYPATSPSLDVDASFRFVKPDALVVGAGKRKSGERTVFLSLFENQMIPSHVLDDEVGLKPVRKALMTIALPMDMAASMNATLTRALQDLQSKAKDEQDSPETD